MGRASRTFWNPLNGVWRHAIWTALWQTRKVGSKVRNPTELLTRMARPNPIETGLWLGNALAMEWTWREGNGLLPRGSAKALANGWRCRGNVFAVTWESSDGKAVKAHSGVLCPDGPCFTQVLTPSKWSKATWPGAGKGLPLQGNVFAVTWEGSGKAVKAIEGFCVVMGRASRTFWNPLNGVWRTGQALAKDCRCRATCSRWSGKAVVGGKGPQRGFVSWWAVLRARFETL